ncbi:uncharacterized protein V6R79_012129 [Siganus canaliculatus]
MFVSVVTVNADIRYSLDNDWCKEFTFLQRDDEFAAQAFCRNLPRGHVIALHKGVAGIYAIIMRHNSNVILNVVLVTNRGDGALSQHRGSQHAAAQVKRFTADCFIREGLIEIHPK